MSLLREKARVRTSAVVFDLGRCGLRAAQVRVRGARCSLNDVLCIELAAATNRASDPTPPPDAARLARLLAQGKFTGRDVALVLSPPDLVYHALRFPEGALRQPRERVLEALSWEVARETRTEPGDLEVRFWRMPPGHREGLNVMAVAMPSRAAREAARSLAEQKLRLRAIQASAPALVRASVLSFTPGPSDLWGILDLGLHYTQLIAVIGTQPVYIRALSVSSDEWTRRIADGFEIPYAEAERIKRRFGVVPAEDAGESSAPPTGDAVLLDNASVAGIVLQLLREPLQKLIREINVCFSYVLQYFPEAVVNRLVLAGGGAALRGLDEYLQTLTGVSTTRLAGPILPTDSGSAAVSGPSITPQTAAAIGAALLDTEST